MSENTSFVFVGIDPGAANAGIAAINHSRDVVLGRHIGVEQSDKGVVGDYSRAISIADRIQASFNYLDIESYADKCDYTVVIFNVEGPALARFSTGSIETGMVHMAIYHSIAKKFNVFDRHKFKIQVIVTPPKTLKKYVTGSGSADKPKMISAIRKRWDLYDSVFDSKDVCEAAALAHMGFDIVFDVVDIGSACQYYELVDDDYTRISHGDIRRCDNMLYFDSDSYA